MATGRSFVAGDLRTRLTIEEKVDTPDGQGGTIHRWGAAAGSGHSWSAWARKQYVSGANTTEGEQTVSRRRFEYTLRQRADVTFTSAMRVVDGTMTLAILSVVADDSDRSAQTVLAEELPT